MAEEPSDLPERVAVLETQAKGFKESIRDLRDDVRALQGKLLYVVSGLMAFGILAQAALQVWLKGAAS